MRERSALYFFVKRMLNFTKQNTEQRLKVNLYSRSKYHASKDSDIWQYPYWRARPVQNHGESDQYLMIGTNGPVTLNERWVSHNRRFSEFVWKENGNYDSDIKKLTPGYYNLELIGSGVKTTYYAGGNVLREYGTSTVVDDGTGGGTVLMTTQLYVKDPDVDSLVITTYSMADSDDKTSPTIVFPEL